MMEQLVPELRQRTPEEIAVSMQEPAVYAPFSDILLDTAAQFSRALFADREAQRYPEIQALAFWTRRAELSRLAESFEGLAQADMLLVPQGVVLHFPPANVDTIFVYSWLLAFLTGNKSIVRLSERAGLAATVLCRVLNQALAAAPPAVRDSCCFVRYGRDEQVTRALSALCQVRVLWGGDATVRHLRETPIPPRAVELTFADRTGLAAIDAGYYLKLPEAGRQQAALNLYNDIFWFDQMGCSSPRMLVWRGGKEAVEEAGADLYPRVAAVAAGKGYSLQAKSHLDKITLACELMIDRGVESFAEYGSLSVLRMSEPSPQLDTHPGAGFLLEWRVEDLSALASCVRWRDQTIAHLGFSITELRALAVSLNGRAVDRMVPLGQALQFGRYWDGYDLLAAFTRRVHLVGSHSD